MIKVPYRPQINKTNCGPAVLQMIFEHWGKKVSQEQLAQDLHTSTAHGTAPEALIAVAQANGFWCQAKNNSTLEEIQNWLAQNIPVIVNFIEPEHNEGHYAIVTDYHDGQLIFNDPWHGQDSRLPEEDFFARWDDFNNLHR